MLTTIGVGLLLTLTAPNDAWLQAVIPLPHEAKLTGRVEVAGTAVAVTAVGQVGAPGETAVKQLRELLGAALGQPAFELRIGLLDARNRVGDAVVPGAARLREVPNRKQAYRIAPVGEQKLLVAALTPAGLYYGAQTLRQLLAAGQQGATFSIPLADITDWPDLAERGLWGGSSVRDIELLSQLKMNLVEAHVDRSVDGQGKGVAKVDPSWVQRGAEHALNLVPIISHFDQLDSTGLFNRYPQLRGTGDKARNPRHDTLQAIKVDQPEFVQVLTDWMSDLAATPGVTTICAWLSENDLNAGDEVTLRDGQFTCEARAIVQAAQQVRKQYPELGVRILLTQGSYKYNEQVLKVVPKDIGITYYDGGRTYDSSRDPMVYPLLEEYAANGGWLGVYPQITASWRIVCPWSGPQFIRARLNEFSDKHLQCYCGYATPDDRLYDFNLAASAEWAWNAKGRDEHEFALAWATRKGLDQPEVVADWAVLLGPIGWDVYGSRIPYSAFFGGAAQAVKRRSAPTWGKGMWRYFPDAAHLAEDRATCARALQLAEQVGAPELLAETKVIGGYLDMLEAVSRLGSTLAGKQELSDADRTELTQAGEDLARATLATSANLKAWSDACGGAGGPRLTDTIDMTEQTGSDIGACLATLGLPNPLKGRLKTLAGKWQSDDFETEEQLTKTYDVTDWLAGPGTYEVSFKYTKGWHGLRIFKVELVGSPDGKPEEQAVVALDEHEGVAAYQNRSNVYRLTVDQVEPGRKYLLLADIKGTRSSDKPQNRRGCEGEVWVQRVGD